MTSPKGNGSDLRIVSKGATPDDVAAVTAVLRGALDELAAAADADGNRVASGWQRTQRPIRSALSPGAGTWRGFTG